MVDLSAELERFQVVLEQGLPAVASSLADATQPDVIEGLRVVLGLDGVPRDLTTLYGWHNGQLPGAPAIHGNRVLLSVGAALAAWGFLNDPHEDHPNPVSRCWLPILYNGAGDYVVYDTTSHQLLAYRHDEISTDVAWPSLAAWVGSAISEVSTAAPAPQDDALRLLKQDPASFVAIVYATASSVELPVLRELRELLQVSLVEMKRMLAKPEVPILSVGLRDTVSRRSVREVIVILDKSGCAPRVTITRDNKQHAEMVPKVFLSALPL